MNKIYGDRYKVIKKLSRGGQGNVFKVFDLETKKDLALKDF